MPATALHDCLSALARTGLAGLFGLICAAPAIATTWTVDSTSADPALNACSAAPADCSFPGAVSRLAFTGDSIVFTVASTLASEVSIAKDVVIDAAGASLPRLVVSTAPGWATVTVRDAVWQNVQSGSDFGGALYIGARQVVSIEDSLFLNNGSTGEGGAIYSQGHLTVTRSRFDGNYSPRGAGAIHSAPGPVQFPGSLLVSDSVFRSNGVQNPAGPAPQRGQFGAIKTDAPATIRNCLFHDNDSNYASAIQSGTSLHIYNSTFWHNITRLSTESGALLLGGPTRIANSTIVGNSGVTSGGMYVYSSSDTHVVNTLIADNTGASPEISGRVYSLGYNLIRNRTGAQIDGNTAGTDIYDADPRLAALADNGGPTLTMALQADSPALNAGSECVLVIGGCDGFPNVALTTDQRGAGYSRARGSRVDIGAFELTQPVMVITSADSGIGSLRQVLADTATGGTVLFSPSFFSQPRTIFLASALLVNRSLTIQGPGAALVTLDSNNIDRVLKVDAPATLTLSGVRLTRGNPGASNSGGGVLVNGGTLSATDVVIDNSRGNQGGCIYNNGSLTLIRARLSACQASFGAGLLNEGGKTANLYDSVIENNISSGGAGGVGNNGSLLLERVTLAGNSATFGGGMINAATATLYNATLSGNTATTNKAGGIYIGVGSSMTLNHATITANTALTFAGGGIWNDGGIIELRNSIIAGNFGSGANVDAVGSITGRGYNLIGTPGGYSFSGGSDLTGNQINMDARLRPLANNASFGGTHAPLWDSPVIDAGGNGLGGDARGLLRPVDFTHIANAGGGNGSDIGAYEVQISTPSAVVASVSPAIGPGAVSVAFNSIGNGGPAATSYTAICGAGSAAGPTSPIVVNGLAAGIAVTCTVTAANASVSGIPSAPSNSVLPVSVPSAPTIALVTAANASVSVAFNPPASNGGSVVTGYTASCGAQSQSGSNSPIVVSGLTNGTAVSCTVIATNAFGNSAPSAASSSVTPSTVPNAPTAVVATPGNTTVSVQFTPPLNNGGSAITGYTATCGARSNSGSGAPIVVSDLVSGVAVTCTVIATNARGNSVASAPSNSAIPGQLPGAPSIGTAVAGNGQVSVMFSAPAANGGSPVTGYTATCGARSASGSASPISVIGLINGAATSCSVKASNVVGSGPASASSNSVTPGLPGAYAYVATGGSDAAVINLANNAVVATIPLVSSQTGVAASPDGSRVYLVSQGTDEVTVINTQTHSVVARIPVPNRPWSAVVSPDSQLIYVTQSSGNAISVISAATNTVISTIPNIQSGYGIAITPDGRRLYVAPAGGSFVYTVNTSTYATDTVPVGNYPVAVAVSPDGTRVYVTALIGNNVTVIQNTTAGPLVIATIPVGSTPHGVTVSPDSRRVYVANSNSNSVSVIDAQSLSVIATVPVGGQPRGIDVAPDSSRAYVINQGSANLSVIDAASNTVSGNIAVGGGGAMHSMGDFMVLGGIAPTITSALPGNGTYFVPYSHTIVASGNPAPSFALEIPVLPPGLSLNQATGVISGVPVAPGQWPTVVVRVGNGVGAPVTQSFSITIAAAVPDAPVIFDVSAGDASVSVNFASPANNGGAPITQFSAYCGGFAASGPASPITVNGLPNGVPVTCTVNAVNAIGGGVASSPSAPVTPGIAPAFSSAALPDGSYATPYQQTLTATGSPAPSFALASGSLPDGLSLDAASGVISGTPSSAGSFNGSLSASNGVGTDATQAFSINIAAGLPGAPSIVGVTPGDGQVTVDFSVPANTGGVPLSGYTASCGGQSQSGSTSPIAVIGLSNGTPVTCAVYASNSAGNGPPSAASVAVTPGVAPSFTSAALPDGTYGTAYQRTLAASGSPAPSFAVTAGTLPTGLSLDASSGVISGTPSSVGFFNGTISASNGIGSAATQAFAISIAAGLPDAPTTVVATRGNAQVSVAFLAPADTGGVPLSGFRASCGGQSASASTSPINVTGLANGTPVTCTVVAINSAGNGVASVPSNSVTPATVPDAPTIGAATPGNASATVAFAAPVLTGGEPIIDYTLSCTPGSSSVTGASSPLTLSALSNGIVHACTISARNAVGIGLASAPVQVIPNAVNTANLSITKTNASHYVSGGLPVTYVITVNNPGPAGVVDARVQDLLDPDFSDASWTCVGQGGAHCAASGNGNLDQSVTLPASSSVQFLLTTTVASMPETPVSNIASVSLPAAITDPELGNNVASDGPDIRGLFRDGLE